MISFDVLINPPTEATIYAAIIAKIVSLGLPIDKLSDRSVAKAIIRGISNTGGNVATLVSNGIKSRFVGRDANGNLLATGGWLTLAAKYDFDVDRTEATFAGGAVALGNTGANSYNPMQPNTFIIKNSKGKAFWNSDAFNLNPGDAGVNVTLVAIEQGTDSNTAPNDTWTIIAPADPKITISNSAAFVASDEQDDDDLTTACTQKIGSWSLAGPRDAYATAVRMAVRDDNGLPVNVNRPPQKVLVSSKGEVTLYLAGPSGPVDSHDIAGVVNSVELVARPDDVTVNVFSVTPVLASGVLTIWAKTTPGVTSDLITSAVNAALETKFATYPIGGVKTSSAQGYLYAETIEGWAQAAHPSIVKVDYTGSDLPLNDGQVAQLATTVTVRFVQVT